jgi:hypothetical protein
MARNRLRAQDTVSVAHFYNDMHKPSVYKFARAMEDKKTYDRPGESSPDTESENDHEYRQKGKGAKVAKTKVPKGMTSSGISFSF